MWPSKQDAQLPSLGDPLSPLPEYEHLPLKLGVTALCRAMEQGQPQSADEEEIETAESKRIPLTVQRPRLLSAIAQEPAFLTTPVENAGALRGTLTHKLLGLLPLDGVRAHCGELYAYIKEETASLETVSSAAGGEEHDIIVCGKVFPFDAGSADAAFDKRPPGVEFQSAYH